MKPKYFYATRIYLFANGERLALRLIGTEVYANSGKLQYSFSKTGNAGIWNHARTISHLDSVLHNYVFRMRV